jgi:hypothetical protein
MKGHCPIGGCPRSDDYDQPSLKQHLLIVHRERPVLVSALLDALDEIAHLRAAAGSTGGHNVETCLLCRREGLRQSVKEEA